MRRALPSALVLLGAVPAVARATPGAGSVSFPAGTSVTVIPPSGDAQILKPGKFSLPAG
jgi:hypothetical protein